jgi:hypothetical protein
MAMTTEYESQHAYWQKDHDEVMKEMREEAVQMEKYPHQIKVQSVIIDTGNNEWYARWHWCGENFTKETYRYSGGYFQFQHEQDAIFFALRWV